MARDPHAGSLGGVIVTHRKLTVCATNRPLLKNQFMRKRKPRGKSRVIGELDQKSHPAVTTDSIGVTVRPDDSSAREGNTPHRLKEIRRDVLKGLLFILLVLSIKLLIERSTFGKHLELMSYGFLQTQLSRERAPITIIDFSNLAQKDYVVNGQIVRATPRQPLQEMIQALAEQKPKAIGVDIDFSPDEDGHFLPREADFFQFCLDIQKQTGVPVFLGIKRTIGDPASQWLGNERYADLAASILVPRDTRSMVSLVKVDHETMPEERERRITTIQSMSSRLASAWGQQADRPAQTLLIRLGLLEKISEKHLDYGVSPEDFLVDYGSLDSIETISATNGAGLKDGSQRDRIFGKLVLIGDATLGKATDLFPVPGREQELYPGVFLHASGAYTLISAPLYELTRTGRLVIDLLLSGVILGALVLTGLFYRDHESRERATHRLRGTFTLVIVITAIVVGVVFVRVTRIMWDDFFLALILLVLHPSIEDRAESLWEKLKSFFERRTHDRAEKETS